MPDPSRRPTPARDPTDQGSGDAAERQLNEISSPDETLPAGLQPGQFRDFLRQQAKISPGWNHKIEASDVVQQTLMEAHNKIEQFRGNSEPEMAKWLSNMLANNIVDAARALQRKKRDITRERPIADMNPDSKHRNDWLIAEVTSPSVKAVRAEQADLVADAIRELPESQRKIIELHHMQGVPVAEIAKRLGCSHAAVGGLLYRALKTLKRKLA